MLNKKFYINVRELMRLPRPKKKLIDGTGDKLPLISIECGLWSNITWV